MANIATKSPSRDDGLVARLAISKNILHEQELSVAISSTIVCPIEGGHNSRGIARRYHTPHDTYFTSSLQCMQRQYHDSINISNLTVHVIEPGAIWFV